MRPAVMRRVLTIVTALSLALSGVLILYEPDTDADDLTASILVDYGPENLIPNSIIHNDFTYSKSGAGAIEAIDGDPGSIAEYGGYNNLYWETNDSYLYWGNATGTGDTSTPWGIGKGIFRLTDPLGNSPYWVLNVTAWVVGITFLSPTWTQIGTYSLSYSGEWCAFNLGIGTTDPAGGSYSYLTHSQMHTEEAQDSWWWVNGEGDYSDPPTQWIRPEGGTNVWPVETHTLYNRPFTLEEVKNLAIIIEVQFLSTIFAHLNGWTAGAGLSIGIGGLMVTAIPVSYTPPTYDDGFILRPDDVWSIDTTDDYFEDQTGSHDDYDLTVAVNESQLDLTDYISANWSTVNNLGHNYVTFSMTDPPDEAPDSDYGYRAYLWIISKSTVQDYNAELFLLYETETYYSSGYRTFIDVMTSYPIFGVSENWANYSMEYSGVSRYGSAFTPFPYYNYYGPIMLDELFDLVSMVQIYPYSNSTDNYPSSLGQVFVAQLAILCVPISVIEHEEQYDLIVYESINGVIWLVIIFVPAIAFGMFVPKIGFVAGMALMLGVFGLSEPGFSPISLMGFFALGVAIYKGR